MIHKPTLSLIVVTAGVMSLSACAAGGGDTGGEGGAGLMGGASGSGTGGVSAGGTGTGGSTTGGTSGTGTGGAPGVGGSSGSVGVGGTSSTGGSTSVGGSSGAGGTGTGGVGGTTGGAGGGTPNPDLIDDLEDNDGSIEDANGRVGAWYTYNDKTVTGTQVPAEGATFVPSAGGNNGSAFGAHTTGNGFATWGAGFGFDLNNRGGVATKGSWNAGAYAGIKFFAKGTPFRMKVLIPPTTPTADGGSCAASASIKCGDNHGKPIAATANWQEFMVPFASLTQEGWGPVAAFSAAAVIGIQFQVPLSTTFDIWIDDISFY